MKHINLDGQADVIKQFVLSLSTERSGSVLELNGKPVLCAAPAPANGSNGHAEGDWNEQKNARRCVLIDREIAGSLTADEAFELENLQQEMLRHRRRVAPLPIDDARTLHQQLLARARSGAESGS